MTCKEVNNKKRRSEIANFLHYKDLPSDVAFKGDIAVDTETKGLQIFNRDRLCVVQLSDGNGDAHVVHLKEEDYANAVNLKNVLADGAGIIAGLIAPS